MQSFECIFVHKVGQGFHRIFRSRQMDSVAQIEYVSRLPACLLQHVGRLLFQNRQRSQ